MNKFYLNLVVIFLLAFAITEYLNNKKKEAIFPLFEEGDRVCIIGIKKIPYFVTSSYIAHNLDVMYYVKNQGIKEFRIPETDLYFNKQCDL